MNFNQSTSVSVEEYGHWNKIPNYCAGQTRPCKNASDFITFDSDSCPFVVDVYLVGVLCVIGIIGTSITIAVLTRDPDKKNTTTWLLQVLAIADLFLLLTSFALQSLWGFSRSRVYDLRWILYAVPYLLPLRLIGQTMTVWMVILITVDRYMAVCRPMDAGWRNMGRMRIIVLVILVVAICYNIPIFFEMGACLLRVCETGELLATPFVTALYLNAQYQLIYRSLSELVFVSVGPLIVLIFLNSRIVWTLQKLKEKRRDMTLQAKEETTITVMLVVVVVVFIICQLPNSALNLSDTIIDNFSIRPKINRDAFNCGRSIGNGLLVLNSSINFLIYCLMWKKFNGLLFQLLGCPRPDCSSRSSSVKEEHI